MAQYFLSLDLQQGHKAKRLHDIFVGIDVWGRGQHGGGGLSSYKALTHIDPQFLGLSVALFGQGWTWESEQDKPGWNWDAWWAYERTLWVGPADPADTPDVEDPHPPGHANSQCEHGPYKPVTSFFALEPPPNPTQLAFFTNFSPGVGRAWFMEGRKVWEAEGAGWTDLDKNCSVGDLLWPSPTLAWHDFERSEALPAVLPSVNMEDAWLGGNSLRLTLSVSGSDAEDAFFRCLWIPVQSLAITPGESYIVTFVYKEDFAAHGAEGDVGLLIKSLGQESVHDIEITPLGSECGDLANGWRRLSVQLVLSTNPAEPSPSDVGCAVGMVLGFATEDPTKPLELAITLGSLVVYPNTLSSAVQTNPKIIWADFAHSPPPGATGSATRFSGILSWEIGDYLAPLTSLTLTGPEDPKPAWPSSTRAPDFLFFNVYALPHASENVALKPEDATFIGSTGLDGRANRFYVDPACLPSGLDNVQTVRFYVQGLTERGTLLRWEDCVFVDISA